MSEAALARFPALVDYQTRRESRWNDLDNPWDIEESFQESEPVLHREVKVFASPKTGGLAMATFQAEGRLSTSITDQQGTIQVTAVAEDLEGIIEEPQNTDDPDIAPRLVLAPVRSDEDRSTWTRVGEGYQGRIEDAMAASDACAKKALELSTDASGAEHTARLLYRFVAQDVRTVDVSPYEHTYAPRAADDVLRDGFGNTLDKSVLSALSKQGVANPLGPQGSGKLDIPCFADDAAGRPGRGRAHADGRPALGRIPGRCQAFRGS